VVVVAGGGRAATGGGFTVGVTCYVLCVTCPWRFPASLRGYRGARGEQ
jgi:hypothetical protein